MVELKQSEHSQYKSQLVWICTQQPVNVSWNVSLGYINITCVLSQLVLMGVCTNPVSFRIVTT